MPLSGPAALSKSSENGTRFRASPQQSPNALALRPEPFDRANPCNKRARGGTKFAPAPHVYTTKEEPVVARQRSRLTRRATRAAQPEVEGGGLADQVCALECGGLLRTS